MNWIKEEFADIENEWFKIEKDEYQRVCPDCKKIPYFIVDIDGCKYCPLCFHKIVGVVKFGENGVKVK